MSGQKYQEEYIRRIHKVQDYIEHHLGDALTIEELSKVAGFSKYHFSRIFQGLLQEPLAHYMNRLRMEGALFLLAHRTDRNMTDIAYELGFSDSAVFSRAFKNFYGISPREYRREYSKNCKDSFYISEYNKGTAKRELEQTSLVVGEITIENMQEKRAMYVRHTGTYQKLAKEYTNLMQKLLTYAQQCNLPMNDETWVLAIYHDNPEFTHERQFRTSLCLTVPEEFQVQEEGALGTMKLEGGLYAVGHFQIQQEQYAGAWNYMYQEWLTRSGYVLRNSYPFEVYCNNPLTDENHIHKVDIYVPIEPILF